MLETSLYSQLLPDLLTRMNLPQGGGVIAIGKFFADG